MSPVSKVVSKAKAKPKAKPAATATPKPAQMVARRAVNLA